MYDVCMMYVWYWYDVCMMYVWYWYDVCISLLNSIAPPENEIGEIVALLYNYLNLTLDIMIVLEIIPQIYNYFEI